MALATMRAGSGFAKPWCIVHKRSSRMGFASEFKEFAVKGNVIDLAVGVIIGGAFGKIVDSAVSDLILPVVSLALGGLDFSNYFVQLSGPAAQTLAEARKAGAVFAYGSFITILINFMILAFVIFWMVKQVNRLKRAATPEAHAAAPAVPVEPVVPEDVRLLREIRDALKR
jgi:large conductance mechanosensitive channel